MDSIERDTLASELLQDSKRESAFKNKMLVVMAFIIVLQALLMCGQSLYHEYQWGQFDTVYVGTEGDGNANYIEGDNNGGVFNGEGYSAQTPQG